MEIENEDLKGRSQEIRVKMQRSEKKWDRHSHELAEVLESVNWLYRIDDTSIR